MIVARAAAILLPAVAMFGCSTAGRTSNDQSAAPASTQETPVSPSSESTACNAAAASFAVGKPWTAELGEQARAASGAKTLRTIRHGDMVTMDYQADRLNLELDEAGRVTHVRCG